MTRFSDELRGSVGERCIVTDLQTAKRYEGVIEAWDDETKKADVRYTSGRLVRVGFSFVELLGDEA
jgi:hypothetical protein